MACNIYFIFFKVENGDIHQVKIKTSIDLKTFRCDKGRLDSQASWNIELLKENILHAGGD